MAGENGANGPSGWDIFAEGVRAVRDVQVARYQPNDPTPNSRGNNDVTAPAGEPAYGNPITETLAATFSDPKNLILLAIAGVLVFILARS